MAELVLKSITGKFLASEYLVPCQSPCSIPILATVKPQGEHYLVQDLKITKNSVMPIHPKWQTHTLSLHRSWEILTSSLSLISRTPFFLSLWTLAPNHLPLNGRISKLVSANSIFGLSCLRGLEIAPTCSHKSWFKTLES